MITRGRMNKHFANTFQMKAKWLPANFNSGERLKKVDNLTSQKRLWTLQIKFSCLKTFILRRILSFIRVEVAKNPEV